MSRKALTLGIVVATLLWSMMALFLAAPKAGAAGCTSGSLIKGPTLPAVYYCGEDGKRYVFTNDKNYFTWYKDFSGVQTISSDQIADIMIGGNVTYRPGMRMVKIQSDPKTYAVGAGGTLRHVTSEAVANCLYGADWNKMVDDVADAFFVNYKVGAEITMCPGDFDPATAKSESACVNKDKGLTTGCAPSVFPITGAPGGPLGVTASSPSSNAANVGLGTSVTVTLSAPLDATTVNNDTFKISSGGGNVAGTISVTGNQVKLDPAEDLRGQTTYVVTLSTGVKDVNGRSLPATSTWSFTTAPTPGVHAPTVTAVTPADGALNIGGGATLTVTFSQPVDTTTLNAASFTLTKGTTTVAGQVTSSDSTATFKPTTNLEPNTLYTATLTGSIMDLNGTALSGGNFTWSFTTAP